MKKNPEQAEALADRQPDVVALQEVRLNALKRFEKLLPELDLPHVAESVHLAAEYDRVYGELIAADGPSSVFRQRMPRFRIPSASSRPGLRVPGVA